jgi:hypothetical protein
MAVKPACTYSNTGVHMCSTGGMYMWRGTCAKATCVAAASESYPFALTRTPVDYSLHRHKLAGYLRDDRRARHGGVLDSHTYTHTPNHNRSIPGMSVFMRAIGC